MTPVTIQHNREEDCCYSASFFPSVLCRDMPCHFHSSYERRIGVGALGVGLEYSLMASRNSHIKGVSDVCCKVRDPAESNRRQVIKTVKDSIMR